MKKTTTFFAALLCLFFMTSLSAQTTKNDPVYLETIANGSKTINFIAGLYPKTYSYSEATENSKMTLRVLNKASNAYDWKDYKVYILLNDNSLFYNYSTKAEEGEFDCTYTIDGNDGYHDQTVCFSHRFDVKDIKEVWLCFGDDTFIHLIYVPGN